MIYFNVFVIETQGMVEPNRRPPSTNQAAQPPPVAPSTVYSSYDPSPSSLSYSNSAAGMTGMSNVPQTMSTHTGTASVMSRLTKAPVTTPTSPQSTWSQRHHNQPDASYGAPAAVYNQMSPARSPSGPTYTQLGSATTTRGRFSTSSIKIIKVLFFITSNLFLLFRNVGSQLARSHTARGTTARSHTSGSSSTCWKPATRPTTRVV